MTSSSKAAESAWQGCIVARPLPDSVCQDYQHLQKPAARQIDPCSLQPGAGAVSHYRRQSLTVGATAASTAASASSSTASTESPDQGKITALSLYLYKGLGDETITTTTTATTLAHNKPNFNHIQTNDPAFTLLQMHRDTNEDISKTLKRMELSVTNKLYPQSKSKKGKSKGKPVQDLNEPAALGSTESESIAAAPATASSLPPAKLPPSIWLTDPSNPSVPIREWDLSNHSNGSFWKDAMTMSSTPSTGPAMVQLDLQSHGNGDDEQEVSNTVRLNLRVDSCPPTITRVATFQDFSASLFVGVPCHVGTEQLFSTRAIVDWYVDGTLVQHDNDLYVPTQDDVDKHVAVLITPVRECQCDSDSDCNCNAHNGEGCQEAYQFERTVDPLPSNTLLQIRPSWTTAPCNPNDTVSSTDGNSDDNNNEKNTNTDIRIVTYNILADQNAFKHNKMPVYPYCPKEFLEKKRRMPLILHELLSYQADILSLQEVDEAVFYALFQPVLEKYGFAGYFSCKSSPGNHEGCAMFWSTSRFGAVGDSSQRLPVPESDQTTHVLSDLFPSPSDVDDEWTSMNDMSALLDQRRDLRHVISSKLGHVAQLLTVQDKMTGRRLLVANTHLFYHPLASHIRLMQMFVLCRQVGRELELCNHAAAAKSNKNEKQDDCLVMMCGDFNSSLTNTAGRLVTERHVPAKFRDVQEHLRTFQWGKRNWGEKGTVSSASTETTAADDFPEINLPDSFPVLQPALTEIPSFTHYISGFFGTLDHILIGQPGLRPVRHAPMPAVRDVARQTAMPSEHLPSDHVSLVCDVAIVQPQEE